MSNLNKEILWRVEQIQKVHKQSFFETITSAVIVHSHRHYRSIEDGISDEEIRACLEAEMHVILNG